MNLGAGLRRHEREFGAAGAYAGTPATRASLSRQSRSAASSAGRTASAPAGESGEWRTAPMAGPRLEPPVSRRSFLRGAGVTVALPWMESLPAWGTSSPAEAPLRFAALFAGNGFHSKEWWARGGGRDEDDPERLVARLPVRRRGENRVEKRLVAGQELATPVKRNGHRSMIRTWRLGAVAS